MSTTILYSADESDMGIDVEGVNKDKFIEWYEMIESHFRNMTFSQLNNWLYKNQHVEHPIRVIALDVFSHAPSDGWR